MFRVRLNLGLLCLTITASLPAPAQPPQILVFAAASLAETMQELGTAYEKTAGVTVKSSFDSSSALARQIEAGSQADVFFSADTAWMDYLQTRSLIKPGSRRSLLGNSLVLIAAAQNRIRLSIAPHFRLAAALGDGRLATGDPDSVPAGRYARSALTTLGVWDEIAPRLAGAENVRVALLYVTRGEAPLGIVYGSDALADKGVRVVATFPEDTHEPIVYPIALTKFAKTQAAGFVAFLTGPQAHDIFVKHGFRVLVP
jgi:molybdate transport system substrate-binding protein